MTFYDPWWFFLSRIFSWLQKCDFLTLTQHFSKLILLSWSEIIFCGSNLNLDGVLSSVWVMWMTWTSLAPTARTWCFPAFGAKRTILTGPRQSISSFVVSCVHARLIKGFNISSLALFFVKLKLKIWFHSFFNWWSYP